MLDHHLTKNPPRRRLFQYGASSIVGELDFFLQVRAPLENPGDSKRTAC